MKKRTRQELGYTIPVKIKLEPGRYKYGWVKTLEPNSRGNLKVYYAGIDSARERSADQCIHEPQGFELLTKP